MNKYLIALWRHIRRGRRRVYRCSHCPFETETCRKLEYDGYTECVDRFT